MNRSALLLVLVACTHPASDANDESGRPGAESGLDSTGAHDSTRPDTAETGETGGPAPALQFIGDKPKNLLMISLDTVRRDQVGYFTGLDTTPNLDALMRQSVVLEDHRSCSTWTAPSVLCVLTGYMPSNHDYFPTAVYESEGPDPNVPWIPDDIHTIASTLSDAGYDTLLLSANGVFSDREGGGMANGFQEIRLPLWFPAPDVETKAVTAAEDVVADGRPFYLQIHFIDPHAPYKAPAEYATDLDTLGPFEWDVSDEHASDAIEAAWDTMTPDEQAHARDFLFTVYRAELRYWDASFATLWADLDAAGALDDTLVVFWTDHGEQFGEHGAFHHGVSLFDQENRSTAFFWAKNLVPREWTGPTIHQDIAPTVFDVLGLPPDPDHEGVKLGDAPADRTEFTFNYIDGWGQPKMAVLEGGYKLVYSWSGEKHFEDLVNDPEETVNLYSPSDPRVLAAWDLLLPKVQALEAAWPGVPATEVGP